MMYVISTSRGGSKQHPTTLMSVRQKSVGVPKRCFCLFLMLLLCNDLALKIKYSVESQE